MIGGWKDAHHRGEKTMPFVNLAVAQATAASIAAPNLVGLFMQYGPNYPYTVAAVAAVIVLIGAFIGARISPSIAPPTLLALVAALAFALAAAGATAALVGPMDGLTEMADQLFAIVPVVAAIVGYFLAVSKRPA
jgi:hypothetical protein